MAISAELKSVSLYRQKEGNPTKNQYFVRIATRFIKEHYSEVLTKVASANNFQCFLKLPLFRFAAICLGLENANKFDMPIDYCHILAVFLFIFAVRKELKFFIGLRRDVQAF